MSGKEEDEVNVVNDSESRKRKIEEEDEHEDAVSKRVATGLDSERSAPQPVFFKMLCPNPMTGGIIGKGGSTLASLMETTDTKIKLSQNNEFFPETQDRIIAISGQPDSVHNCIAEVTKKLCELADKESARISAPRPNHAGGKYLVRSLVPSTATGCLIGQKGCIIKDISEKSGAKLKLGDAADPYHTRERIMNAWGPSVDNVISAMQRVFAQLLSEPTSGSYSNTTTTYGVSAPQQQIPSPYTAYAQPQHQPLHVQTPQSYYPPAQPYSSSAHVPYQQQGYSSYTAGQYSGGRDPAPGYESYGGRAAAPTGNSPAVADPYSSTHNTVHIAVPENLVGAVLGKGGYIIKDMMAQSGAKILLSQKGEYIPGTTQRSLSISGSKQQVDHARDLVMHQLNTNAVTGGRR